MYSLILCDLQPVESFVLKGLWQPEGEEAKMRIAREAVAKRHENVFVEKRRTVRRMHKLEDSNQLVGDAGKDSVQETGMAARVTHDEADGNDEGRGQGMLRELIEKAKVKGISARRKGMDMEGAHRRKANVLESLVKKAKSEAASFQKETKFFVGAFDHNTHEQSAAK